MPVTRRTGARRRPHARAASRSRARRGRSRRATSRSSTCCWRWTARTCTACVRSRRTGSQTRRGCCASTTRRRPARRTSTSRTLTTAARAGSRPCSTRSRPPAVDSSPSFADAVRAATGRDVRRAERAGGGDINDAYRVQFADESFGFVKTRAAVAAGEYAAEAAALRWLAQPGALRVPEVLGVSDTVLVLDWVDEG